MKIKKYIKLLILVLILLILILICKRILIFDSINYKINIEGNKINIKEIYENNNYYLEIKYNNNYYTFRIYEDLNKKRKIVKNLYLYKDKNIDCLLPVINDSLYTDMLCYKDNTLYDYHNIISKNESLDKFVETIELYNINNFKNQEIDTKIVGTVKYNIFNNIKNNVVITTYNGLMINTDEIKLFEKDVYNNKLSIFFDNYYLIADYENDYSFNYFYIVNLNTKEIIKLETKNDISYDSYIQGIVDNKVYLYDKDNEIQYEINIKEYKINIVSSDNYIKYYCNNKWERMNKTKANKEIYFDYQSLDNKFSKFDYVQKSNDYYYLYKKDGIFYKLYRIDKDNLEVYKYILDVPTTNIYFNNNYLYYTYKNKLYYYSDNTGLKTLLENSELEFNDTIKYYIY